MKLNEKQKAIELRKAGKSINSIAKELKVTKSSVSLWVRNVQLTEVQKELLFLKNPSAGRGAERRSELAKNKRLDWQEEGRTQAKKKEWLHAAGCMLYWGEGSKKRNVCAICNSDINILKLFLKFLITYFNTTNNDISIECNCYAETNEQVIEIESYWVTNLGLSRDKLIKTQINKLPSSSKGYYKNKLKYGTCKLMVYNTQIIQHIYGAIQEYGDFNDAKLVD